MNKKRQLNITKEVLAWLYESNSTYAIGVMFGFGDETVRKKLIKYGINRRPPSKVPIKIPSKKSIEAVYPKLTIEQAAEHFGVKQTLMFKWLNHYRIPTTKKPRVPRSEAHKKALSVSHKGKVYLERRTGENKPCASCGKIIYIPPPRLRQSEIHYCDMHCKGMDIRLIPFSKNCPECDTSFDRREGETAGNYRRRIYCSKKCAVRAAPPPILIGEDNPKYKGEEARRRQPRGGHGTWRKQVLMRDKYTCQNCGIKDVPLHAHHVLSFEDFPDERNNIDNGLTLCIPCHYMEHGYSLSEAGIKTLVDERGVTYRRWSGLCLWCGNHIEKQASDMKRPDGTYRTYGFCNKSCAMKANGAARQGIPRSETKGFNVSEVFEKWATEQSF